jgi:cobalt-zinc-cadmium efflux system outer membrane protein
MKLNFFIAFLVFFAPIKAIQAEKLLLKDILQYALQNSPLNAEISRDLATKNATAYELETLNNPVAGFNMSFPNSGNDSHIAEIELEQTFKLSNFGSRQQYANAFRHTASIEHRAQTLELVHTLSRGYAAYWLLQEQVEIVAEKIRYTVKKQKLVETAARQGRIDIADAKLLKAEVLRLQEQLRVLQAKKQTGAANLMHLAGMQKRNFKVDLDLTFKLPDQNSIHEMAEDRGGILALLKARNDLAEKRLAVAKEDLVFSEFTPKAVIERNFDDHNTSLILGVSIALPIWDRNNAELARAKAEQTLSQTSLNSLNRNNFNKVLEASYKKAKSAQQTADNFRNNILPIWQEVESITDQKFAYGQASIFELLQMYERITEVENEALQAELNVIETRIELESLIGRSFSYEGEY